MESLLLQLVLTAVHASSYPLIGSCYSTLLPFKQSEGSELVFKDLRVDIDKKAILKGIDGLAIPGEMLAIMGPSGNIVLRLY